MKKKRRGEVYDLQVLLKRALKRTTPKELNDLLKKIIMYMTLGVDVSVLFADMCLISQYPNLLSKKMIYLYLGNYAEANPSLALLAVNTFVKELTNKEKKIRGLALRSLCSLKSQFSTTKTHIIEMLNDKEPYVQKIAIYGCLKVFYKDKKFFEEFDLYDTFYNMIKSTSPVIIISIINVLNEVFMEDGGMTINSKIITYLLNRLKEFNDYGKSVIVELAIKYNPKNEEEKIKIMNLLDSKFKSSNSYLVINIVKLFIHYNQTNAELYAQVLDRIKDSLITHLISVENEEKFNILHHIYEIIKMGGAKYFEKDYKRFFCESEDKNYIQEIKLKILKHLVTEASFDDIFNELSEYINEVNYPLAKESVLIIGQLGQKHKERVNAIILLFMNILKMKKTYLYDNVIIALKNIYSTGTLVKSREQTELFENFGNFIDIIKEEKAQICLLWLLARFNSKIKHSSYILNRFVKDYQDNKICNEEFKIQLLNTTIFLFLKNPKETLPVLSRMFSNVFKKQGENPYLISKCKLYYQFMENDFKKFEEYFLKFFEELSFVNKKIEKENKSDYHYMNTFSIIYHKNGDVFTKPREFFIAQRKQAGQDPENKNNLDINSDEEEEEKVVEEKKIEEKKEDSLSDSDSDSEEEEEKVEEKKKVIEEKKIEKKKNDDIDFLDFDFGGENDNTNTGEDLGIMDIDFGNAKADKKEKNELKPRKKKLRLTQNELDPSDFQNLWGNWEKNKEFEISLDVDVEEKDDLVDIFEERNLFCIASQENEGDLKFYFYCQEKKSENYYLIEINICDGDEFSLILKFDQDEDTAGRVLDLVDDILRSNNYIE